MLFRSVSQSRYYADGRRESILLAKFSGDTGVTYNSTTGEIAIGQAVATTSDVTFNTARTALSMATGGASLTSGAVNTFVTLGATGTVSGSISTLGLRAVNVTTGYGASSLIIDHGQNRPSGTSTTSGSPVFGLESAHGGCLGIRSR